MHAAEDDVVGRWVVGNRAGELERVAGVVGEANDFVALVVMAEDDEAFTKRRPRGGNAQRHLLVGQPEIRLWERLPLVDGFFSTSFNTGKNVRSPE